VGSSITRDIVLIALLAAVPAGAAVSWREAAEYVSLFAPVGYADSYGIAVTPTDLDAVLTILDADQTLVRTPGAWAVRQESATDVFGTAGRYNRWLLARLYGSRQVRVARGARADRGRVVEAWTLVSPYPSADLRTLHPGTMRLILNVSP
jgi:hypothetical protein